MRSDAQAKAFPPFLTLARGGRPDTAPSRRVAPPKIALVPPSARSGDDGAHEDDVRWAKVMTAQARIAVGYYDRSDVKERVLDAVLDELEPR